MNADKLDAVVVGGGIAGLSAALWLARYRRAVRVYDTGEPRNDPAWAVHGYPGLPDTPPHQLRARMRDQAGEAGAQLADGPVEGVEGGKDDFTVRLKNGEGIRARRVILAYGRLDLLPPIEGIEPLYGRSVFHCPDCDGPSVAGARIGVVGNQKAAANLALYLRTWTDQIVLLTDGRELELDHEQRATLRRCGLHVRTEKIVRLSDQAGLLRAAELADSPAEPLGALFFHRGSVPACAIAESMGCGCDDDGYITTDRSGETTIPGLYAAGDLIGHPHLAISAAAEGVVAALAIHRSLLPADDRL